MVLCRWVWITQHTDCWLFRLFWSDFYRINRLRGWGLYRMWAWHPQKFCAPSLQIPPSNNPRSATATCSTRTQWVYRNGHSRFVQCLGGEYQMDILLHSLNSYFPGHLNSWQCSFIGSLFCCFCDKSWFVKFPVFKFLLNSTFVEFPVFKFCWISSFCHFAEFPAFLSASTATH